VILASTRALWYATRGTGVVALVLLTAVVVLGITTSARVKTPRWPRFVVAGLHRNLSLLALVFIGAHVLTTVVDGYAPIGLKDAVIPFVSAYRPVWLGLGAVAFDLLLALTVTSLLRARIGIRTWRAVHWLAYASWPVALMHGLGTGTDARLGWMQLLAFGSTLVVVAALLYRIAVDRTWTRVRAGAVAAALAVPAAVGVWYAQGPGRAGWAARAGTPASLLPHTVATPTRVSSAQLASASASLPAPPYRRSFSGTITQTGPDANGELLVSIRGATSSPQPGVLWVRLQGVPVDGGGVSMTASGASFGPRADPQAYVGKIVGLEGTRIELALQGRSRSIDVLLDLQLKQGSSRVTGRVRVTSGGGAE
jgi:hypothetical protein